MRRNCTHGRPMTILKRQVDPDCLRTAMPRCRPFKLIDVMIVIASASIGMTSIRPMWNRLQLVGMDSRNGIPWQVYAGAVKSGLTMFLLMLLTAYIWMRLIPPRLPVSDLIRQPGALFFGLLCGFSILLLPLSAFVPLDDASTMRIFAIALGSSWLVACRRYRSRAEPGWIEGLGRFYGVGLLLVIAAG